MDALYKMFVERKSVILKMNPVNAYLGPFIEEAFCELVDAGYFAVVYGGAEVGAYLVEHAGVDEIHITGSNHTHDRIVWGPPGPEREARIAANDPLVKKEITSELGNVSPVVVVPGVFSEKELDFQAANIASMLANNAGFNCNAAKLLVLSRHWPQRERFLERLAEKFREIPPRKAYYPGAAERHRRFLEGHAHVETFGEAGEGELPWALIRDIDPEARDDLCFREEAFCSILGETSLPEKDPLAFLDRAVTFCNEAVWGTLNITLIVPSAFERNEREAMLAAIDRLRYGTVGINHWAGLVYGMVSPPWGAFPGSPLTDIQSGRGWVHNTFLFDAPQKVVLRGPLTVSPRPAWFYDHRSVHELGRRLTRFEETGSLLALPSVVFSALKG
ncbi:MAG: aldehyde dehydrogenase family protein [Deltaproteobacteria bacterium]|nr:MAG: aldehyde dehydrogenase family protein [Deltaproteobacteria bacterium]